MGGKWTEESKLNWSRRCKEEKVNNKNRPKMTNELREKYKVSAQKYWTDENRQTQSQRMKQIVKNNPDSYSKNNVSGRCKMYEVDSPAGKTKVKGKWELIVANFLNEHNIDWTNNIEPIPYQWNGSWHLYFPDFKVGDTLIEVKGYKTERDDCKWNAVSDLVVLTGKDIKNLADGRAGALSGLISR